MSASLLMRDDARAAQWHGWDGRTQGSGLLALAPGQTDLWAAHIDACVAAGVAGRFSHLLHESERQAWGRFVFEKDQRRYVVTRLLQRYVLSRYAPVLPQEWRFQASSHGRPFIANTHPAVAGLTFNLSHSDRRVLLAVTRGRRLGVDVEDACRAAHSDIAQSYFTAHELHQLQRLPAVQQPQHFLAFWTLKESYIKARGLGLSIPLNQFAFDLGTAHDARIHFQPTADDHLGRWKFWQWQPDKDSMAALCVELHGAGRESIVVRNAVPFLSEELGVFMASRES
ncbi:MAG TPA: 4'-phosphopantetheinyl transferase superfamily protein [Alcaligenes sp.]|nr:4'-phosphopantetheinyl transferase superfamily protein [Alcaligenes sp.]